tara:strand:- start:101731 stop:102414 length:684 start_codon:yes stop_codon:yes gene_type:complete
MRVALFLTILIFSTGYFLKIENGYVRNNLVCNFSSQSMEKISQNYQTKFKQLLPNKFPNRRLEYLSQKILAKPDPNLVLTCNQEEKKIYESSFLFEYRSQIYPIFPDSFDTLDWIAVSHRKEGLMLSQLEKFKKIVIQEKENFNAFTLDCSMVQELSEQVKLLEKHLKLEKQPRQPSNTKSAISRMNKNISRQLEFAKKHFQTNEKLFLSKWKRFFEFESEKTLCPF